MITVMGIYLLHLTSIYRYIPKYGNPNNEIETPTKRYMSS